ncbi:glycoside hydrolase family 3 C-terminal domain-containing protein [Microbulbifer agarilyticus]|uniref:glycoside hydrolase family 3 N-terminal domain-containing protein n=1 Tax=Microbulbifer agarilyticus TaxID=260552 RepID=UPI001C95AB9D|nr:glycoside hydrolase family 3 N-terminal domain-containing protein [Microbulbifer agarilyticus]MBY6213050.1 glycoside hydrolase family 3 C-terminal domain-containing protein [Microbulbifer agarilyticus]
MVFKKRILLGVISALVAGGGLLGCADQVEDQVADQQSESVHPHWPALTSGIAKDPEIESRIDALLEKMSLEEKIGQMIQVEIRFATPDEVREYHIGSILNGGGAFPNNNKHASVADWVALADEYYRASVDTSDGGVAIPMIWGTDAVHGHNNVIGATLFPHNIALGAAQNPALMRKIGEATAAEVSATGIEWVFAPTLAVVRDDRWGRTYESYSEDPELVRAYAGELVQGMQGAPGDQELLNGKRVVGTAKHYIADGGTENGIDRGDAIMSEADLIKYHAQGYFSAIEAGVQTVMASFSSWNGEKMHGHKYLMTDVLKERLGFDGFVVGDWAGHQFVNGCSNVSCPQAVNAGLDMFMAPDPNWRELYKNTLAEAKSGEISPARLDDAVRRILRVKLRAGLFEAGLPSTRPHAGDESLIGAAEHRAIARQAVRESLVLLKNNDQLLPLARNQRVLVAGDGADNIGKQSGGWSITWQGTGNENADFPGATSVYGGINEVVAAAGGQVELSVDGSFEEKPDVAVVVFGEDPYAEMQGDIANVNYAGASDLALLKKLRDQGIPVVSLFITGRPLWVNPHINASDAFAVIWLPGTEAGGVADVLFQDEAGNVNFDFTGKLTFSWPGDATPALHNRGESDAAAQFAYGYGLSYGEGMELALLSEESGLQPVSGNGTLAVFNGRALDPWSFEVIDATNTRSTIASSVSELNGIRVQSVDRNVQEDSRRLQWNGQGNAIAGFFANQRTDLSGFVSNQGALIFDVKVDAAPSDAVILGMNCGMDCGAEQPITDLLKGAAQGEWQTLAVDLKCLAEAGGKMDLVLSPFYVRTAGELDMTVHNVRIAQTGAAKVSCG